MKTLLTVLLMIVSACAFSQKFVIEKSEVSFFSDAAIEDITANNKKSSGLFNAGTSEIVFSIPIMEFQFEKSLMQEHFNEKYMESEKYPKSTFQGKVKDFDAAKSGIQKVTAVGKLTIHGVTKDVTIPGTIEKQGENYIMTSKFMVKLADYNITIPQLLWQKIAEQVEVSTNFKFKAQSR